MQQPSADRGRERALAWAAVLLWTGVILLLSTDSFSADETSRIIGPLLDFFFPGLEAATRALVHAGVRKSAHAFEYAVLAILAWRALHLEMPGRERRATLLALALALGVASVDETGQATRAARTGSPIDVALDGAGGAAGLALAHGAAAWQRRRRTLR
jgi:VanZ family protein